MSMEIINGYVCRNCTDAELAKRGVDPAKPKDDPKNPAYDAAKAKGDHGPSFKLGGALAKSGVEGSSTNALPPVNGVAATDGTNGASATNSTGAPGPNGAVPPPGSVLNIAA